MKSKFMLWRAMGLSAVVACCFVNVYAQNWEVNGNTSASGEFLGTTNNFPLVIRTNNTDRMTVLESGQVGVGTTTPTLAFDVVGSIGVTGDIQGKESGGILGIYANTDNTNGAYIRLSGQDWGGNMTFNTGLNGSTGTNGIFRWVQWTGGGWRDLMRLDGAGNLGLGTLSPARTFDMVGTARITNAPTSPPGDPAMEIVTTHGSGIGTAFGYGLSVSCDNPFTKGLAVFNTDGGVTETFRVYANGKTYIGGNVGIGKQQDPNYALDVAGTIRSCAVLVEANGWCDYVFEEDYELMDIDTLHSYLKVNKHLPNIPSASEVEANGQNLAEYQKMMMEKIEELSLYVIELHDRVKTLETENATLREGEQK